MKFDSTSKFVPRNPSQTPFIIVMYKNDVSPPRIKCFFPWRNMDVPGLFPTLPPRYQGKRKTFSPGINYNVNMIICKYDFLPLGNILYIFLPTPIYTLKMCKMRVFPTKQKQYSPEKCVSYYFPRKLMGINSLPNPS